MKKKSLEERVKTALEQKELCRYEKEEIVNILKKMPIECKISIVAPSEIDYDKMPKVEVNERKYTSLVFIQFTKNGYIAVVGAGKDIGFPKNSVTSKIISASGVDEEWDKENVIIVEIFGLKGIGLKSVNNVLKCRNGVENYIGDYLTEQGIPILNYYQHWNYKEEVWKDWKEKNFII